jgi:molecular chaperone DnaJ
MPSSDAYAELGLAPEASDAELKAAWRRLVARWHPDRNRRPDAAQRMQRINSAYLSIREARSGAGSEGEGCGGQGKGRADARSAERRKSRSDDTADHQAAGSGDSASRQAAGAGRKTGKGAGSRRGHRAGARAGPSAGAKAANPDPDSPEAAEAAEAGHARTVRRKLSLSLEEATLGCTRVLSGRLALACGGCAGGGWQVLASVCPTCRGEGRLRRASLFGWLPSAPEDCSDCGATGRARTPCGRCEGQGRRSTAWRRTVRLPAGVRAGDVLTAPGGSHGGTELVLELQLAIEPHPFFVLEADGTLRCEMPVDGFAWMGERWVEVPTPDGLQQMRLRREHRSYRLRSQGFPVTRRGVRGDLLIEIRPVFPDALSPAQEELLDRLVASAASAGSAAVPLQDWQRRLRGWAGPAHPG